jgi:hypothetical protein
VPVGLALCIGECGLLFTAGLQSTKLLLATGTAVAGIGAKAQALLGAQRDEIPRPSDAIPAIAGRTHPPTDESNLRPLPQEIGVRLGDEVERLAFALAREHLTFGAVEVE